MTHFPVVVFTKDGSESEVERLLAPYQEGEEWGEEGTRWDWWIVGGRWDGEMLGLEELHDDEHGFHFAPKFHTLERNSCDPRAIEAGFTPWAFVTPDGEWHEAGRMGWFGMSDGEDEHFAAAFTEAKGAFADAIAILVDCHV